MAKASLPLVLVIGLAALPWLLSADPPIPLLKEEEPRLRRPIALILADGGKTLLVANRDSGTISIVDTLSLKIVSETRVAKKLADLAATPTGDLLAACDEQAGEVVLLQYRERVLLETRRFKVGSSPVSVRLRDDGRQATVARLWARQLTILDLSPEGKAAAPLHLNLPFAPRRQLLLPGSSRMLVADSFGAGVAVVDLKKSKVERAHTLASAHNIRGLALDHKQKHVFLTHQVLHATGHPNPGEIRSANVIANELRKLPLADLLDPLADPLRQDRVHPLGDIVRGAGDPAEVVQTEDGMTVVAYAGVNEVALGWPERATWSRVPVGKRPTALAIDNARRRAFVANTFSDSISVVDLDDASVSAEVRLTPGKVVLTSQEQGEVLFFDATLSLDGWYSCHSCHTDGHTNGRLNDNFTDGSFGTPKRVLSLLGVKDTGPWAWDGKMSELDKQVRNSITSTMQGHAPRPEQVKHLLAFLQTLTPPPSLARERGALDREAVERGRTIFQEQKCGACHKEPEYTTPRTYDVGLRDEAGLSQFNPPSLRGLSQAGPYFHDNRARTLEEVFTRFRHRLSGDLSDQERGDLLYFLGSL